MVNDAAAELDGVFHALAHPARRDIVHRLSRGDQTVGELAAPLRMSLPAASKHVRVLEQARLVQKTVRGRTHVCSLTARRLADAQRWLRAVEQQCNEELDNLEAPLAPDDRTTP